MKIPALLLGAAILLAGNLTITMVDIDTSAVRVNASERRPQAKDASQATPAPEEDLTHYILERPLFSPDRRDFVAPADVVAAAPASVEQAAPPQAPTLQVRLLGTRIIRSQQAALLELADQDARWYPVGDAIEGWTIQDISGAGVMLVSGSSQQFVMFAEATENGP